MTKIGTPAPEDEKPRDRPRTEEAIVAAAKAVLADQGFGGWGVNAIARAAGCDKQLIYRYFGGLDGLAEAIGRDLAAELELAMASPPATKPQSYAELVSMLLDAFLQVLRANRLMQRIIAWELSAANPLTLRFAAARAESLGGWIVRARGSLTPPEAIDAPAINAMLIGAIQHMVLSSETSNSFAGVALSADADWERISTALRNLVLAAYGASAAAQN